MAFRPFFPLLLMLAAVPVRADEAQIRKAVAAFTGAPETVVESVTRIPQGGLYEVLLTNGELFYSDKAASFFVLGSIIDTKTGRDLTRERLGKLSRIDFKTLPLEQAIRRGSGKRVLVTFEDPYCVYCKRLGQELKKVENLTVYTFLYPILSADSIALSRRIWCARDRASAWTDWIIEGKEPSSQNCDSSVVDRNVALGRKLRVNGTPAMFFVNGERVAGFLEAGDINRLLSEAKSSEK